MFTIDTESVILATGYLGIFGLMVANGFISFPSSQVLYIVAGYFISTGHLSWILTPLVGAIGNTVGNIILYELARARGLHYITKFRIFPEREVKKVNAVFKRRGSWFIFVGKLLPALKVFVPIPAGLAKMNRVIYISLIAASSYIWALGFLAIGFYFGKSSDLFGKYAVVLTIVAALVLLVFYRYMQSEEISKEIDGK